MPDPLVFVAKTKAVRVFFVMAICLAKLSPLETWDAAVCNDEEEKPWMLSPRIPIMMAMMATTTSNSTKENAAVLDF